MKLSHLSLLRLRLDNYFYSIAGHSMSRARICMSRGTIIVGLCSEKAG